MIPTALAILAYGMISALLGTLLPDLSRRLALSDGQSGTAAFVQSVGLIISCLLTGILIDRKGTKVGLVGGLGIAALALVGLAQASSFALLAGSMLWLGLGSGMVSTSTNTIASELSPERRPAMLSFMNVFFGVGGLLTPLIGAYVFGINKVGLCYLVASITTAVFLTNVFVPSKPRPKTDSFSLTEALKLIGNSQLILMSLMLFLYVGCEVGMWNWLARHLVSQGIPENTALRTLSFGFALGMLLGRLVASRILVSVSVVNVTLVSALIMALTTWGVLQTNDPRLAGVLVFCAGLAMAPVFPAILGLVGDRFPVMTATAMGVAITSGCIGLAVSSKMIGVLAGSDPKRLKTALLVLPAFSLAMVIVNLLLRTSLRGSVAPRDPVPA